MTFVWLFVRFIVRQVRAEPLRTFGAVVGIALGIAVVVAIRLANGSSIAGFEAALDAVAGRTSVEIVGSAVGIDETRVAELAWLGEFGEVSAVVDGEALAAVGRQGPDGSRRRSGELLRILGVDILRDRSLRDYALVESPRPEHATGSEPDALAFLDILLDPSAIVLTEKFARRHDLREGSTIGLVIGDTERRFVVRGLLKDEGPARLIDGTFALMDIAAAQWALGRLGHVDRLDIRLAEPAAIAEAEAAIAARLPDGLSVQRPARRGRQVERMLAAFHLNLAALSYIALIVGLFLVYNTVSISVISRRHEIGTLRALGVTRAGILALFLGEALLLALAGTTLGLVLGRLLGHAAIALTSTTVTTLYVATAAAAPALTGQEVVVAFALGVILSLVAAWVPSREAARVPPIAAIQGLDRLETRASLRPRQLVLPALLLALGAWLATRGPIGGLPVAGYASAVALVFGAASLVPAVLFAAGRVGSRVMPALFGVEGLLANANLSAAIRRLSISVAALAISLAMMVAIAVMIGSFRETVVEWVHQTFKADLFISPAARHAGARSAPISEEVERLVAGHPAVEAVDGFRSMSIPFGDTQAFLGAGDFDVLLRRGNLLFKAPADARARMREAIGRDDVVVTEAFSLKHGIGVGDAVPLTTPAGVRSFRVVAVYYDYSSDRGSVVMDRRTFDRHFGDERPTSLTVYLREGSDPDAVRSALLDSLGAGRPLHVFTNAGLRGEVLRIFDSTFAITYALEVVAVFVAIVGVAATLLTLTLERRRELVTLGLVGAGRRQIRKMVMLEAAMLGGVSQAIGLAVGIALSLVLIFVVNVQSFGWTIQFRVPFSFLTQMALVILAATTLAGIYPARVASRLPVAEATEDE